MSFIHSFKCYKQDLMKKFGFIILLFISITSFGQTTTTKKTTTKKTTKKTSAKTQKLPANTEVWTVDAMRAKCEGVITSNCLLVKKPGDRDFNLFYDNIIGFDYEDGFIYTLWVKKEAKTPPIPADASIYNYVLVKIASKKAVASYNTKPAEVKPQSGLNTTITKTLVVNEERVPCNGNPDAKCLLIKQPGKTTFEIFNQSIQGFVFDPGYRQTIVVQERYVANPMVKQAEPIYTLVEVVKKELINVVIKDSVATTQPKTALDRKWTLRKMKDTDTSSLLIEDNGVYIQFNSSENKVTGKAPCNTFFGGLQSDYISTIQLVAVANSRMYCENNMKFEDLFFTLLQNAQRFEIKDNQLSLYKGDRLLLVFE